MLCNKRRYIKYVHYETIKTIFKTQWNNLIEKNYQNNSNFHRRYKKQKISPPNATDSGIFIKEFSKTENS